MLYPLGFIVVEHVTREFCLLCVCVCVSILYPVTAPCLEILCAYECARVFVGGDLQVLRTLLEKSEDCHQKSDQTRRCKRTTSERASSRDARNTHNRMSSFNYI